jgi:hypothetical protein
MSALDPQVQRVARETLHLRSIELRGYGREDGLFDIEARMIDRKTRELTLGDGRVLPAGEPLHDMWVRLVVDEDLVVVDISASTQVAPWGVCRDATATLQVMRGARIGGGWSTAIRQRLAGRNGCTHLTELLRALATVAFQTIEPVRPIAPVAVDTHGTPRKIDSCYAYASDREVVRLRWPRHYDGDLPEARARSERAAD